MDIEQMSKHMSLAIKVLTLKEKRCKYGTEEKEKEPRTVIKTPICEARSSCKKIRWGGVAHEHMCASYLCSLKVARSNDFT